MHGILKTLGLLLVIVLLAGGGLGFGYVTMKKEKEEEGRLNTELQTERQKGNIMNAQKRTLAAIEKDHNDLAAFLFETNEESQIKFISEIEQLGTSTTGAIVETKSLSLIPGEAPGFRGEFAISGTWSQVYHFLRLIEEFPSRVVINRFDVKANGTDGGWSGTVQLDLTSLRSAQ